MHRNRIARLSVLAVACLWALWTPSAAAAGSDLCKGKHRLFKNGVAGLTVSVPASQPSVTYSVDTIEADPLNVKHKSKYKKSEFDTSKPSIKHYTHRVTGGSGLGEFKLDYILLVVVS